MPRTVALKFLAAAAAGLLVLSACTSDREGGAGSDGATETSTASRTKDCSTITEGKLTIATGSPASAPWFADGDPSNGKGFESAVAYAVADQLGYQAADVEWTTVPTGSADAAGEEDADFEIGQVRITDDETEAVDLSDGYYDVNQALVALQDSSALGVTRVSNLKGVKLGAQTGTTSLDFIDEVIKPEQAPLAYDDEVAATAALESGAVDAIVVELPTALAVVTPAIEGSSVIGQFPSTSEDPEQFGMAFEEGSGLVGCVNDALTTLRGDGTLDAIRQEWLGDILAPSIAID